MPFLLVKKLLYTLNTYFLLTVAAKEKCFKQASCALSFNMVSIKKYYIRPNLRFLLKFIQPIKILKPANLKLYPSAASVRMWKINKTLNLQHLNKIFFSYSGQDARVILMVWFSSNISSILSSISRFFLWSWSSTPI